MKGRKCTKATSSASRAAPGAAPARICITRCAITTSLSTPKNSWRPAGMFLRNNGNGIAKPSSRKETIPTIITHDVHILGNIVSDGNIDFDGTLNGNIRCHTLTIRAGGAIQGEVIAENVLIYGKVKGLIRAKNVQLFATCNVEGIIMHET